MGLIPRPHFDILRGRKQRLRKYVEVSDFHIPRLTADMSARHPAIPKKEIEWFVPFSVFVYHVLSRSAEQGS